MEEEDSELDQLDYVDRDESDRDEGDREETEVDVDNPNDSEDDLEDTAVENRADEILGADGIMGNRVELAVYITRLEQVSKSYDFAKHFPSTTHYQELSLKKPSK